MLINSNSGVMILTDFDLYFLRICSHVHVKFNVLQNDRGFIAVGYFVPTSFFSDIAFHFGSVNWFEACRVDLLQETTDEVAVLLR